MIHVSRVEDGGAVEFFDAIGNASIRVQLSEHASVGTADPTAFPFPIETARRIEARRMSIDRVPSIAIRDERGEVLETTYSRSARLSRRGRTFVELCTPVKLYVGVDGFVEVTTDAARTTLDFGQLRTVQIGARVKHDRPELTVTTREHLTDIFKAISTFGRVDQPGGPERSFQSLRRHPPVIEFGSTLDIPDELDAPASQLRLELPATYLHAAVGAPLAYYLGAELVPGRPPRLSLDDEVLVTWADDDALQDGCARLLQRVFFLDCLAREGQGYGVTVPARSAVANRLGVSWAELAELDPGPRVRAYLGLPMEPIDEHLPAWTARAYVVPNRTTIETLPYLAYDLIPAFRSRQSTDLPRPSNRPLANGSGSGGIDRVVSGRTLTLGDPRPVGSDGVTRAALRNRTLRDTESDSVTVTIVCNDPRMLPERDSVESIYGSLAASTVEVRRHEDLTVRELATVLSTSTDFLHYIGHILADGFQCVDGGLSTNTVSAVGAEVFFLNACQSVREGRWMIERGAVGGIVTRSPVGNQGAIVAGRSIAELLIRGYPLGVALELAKEAHPICRDYTAIGDPRIEIADTESGLPYLCEVRPDGDAFVVSLRTVLTTSVRKGSLGSFHLGGDDGYTLNPAACEYRVDPGTLDAFLADERVPVRWDGEWRWSDDCRAELAAHT